MAWGQPEVAEAAPAPALTPEQFAAMRDAKIREWLGVTADLAQVKEQEMRLRKELTALMFPEPKKGTQRHAIGEGYNMKLEYKLNYKLGEADKTDDRGEKISIASQVSSLEDEIIGCCTEGEFLATRLIKWTPALSVSEYEKLDGENGLLVKKLIDAVLTIEPAAPTLSFEPPKVKE